MRILQRYVLSEIKLPFILSFLTLNFIFMAGYLVKAADFIIGRGIPLFDTLQVLVLALPEMISYTAPMSILTAVLIVFGSLSQNNEIRAMKASGIHPFHVMIPALLIGLALSVVMFVFNDQIATNASFELRRTTKKMLIKHPSAIIEPGRFVKLSDTIVFLAKRQNGNRIEDVVAYENDGTDKAVRTIIADHGEITTENGTKLKIRLFDGSVSDSKDATVQSIQFHTYEFPTVGQEDIQKMRKKTRDLTLAELLLRAVKTDRKEQKEDFREIWSSFHQRIAFAWGSFIFVLIGIPIAILVHRGEIVLSFGIAIIATSIYYILFVGAKTLSLQGGLPPVVAFWIPNILLVGLGIFLLRRSVTA